MPKMGTASEEFDLDSWSSISNSMKFPLSSPPDIHAVNRDNEESFWEIDDMHGHGNSFIGMVVRSDNSYESISQKLPTPLRKGQSYRFSIHLAQSSTYKSPTIDSINVLSDFDIPAVLKIYGGAHWGSTNQLLAVSPPIGNNQWKKYTFEFCPSEDSDFIVLEASYSKEKNAPYNGHILLDNASYFQHLSTPKDSLIACAISEQSLEKIGIDEVKIIFEAASVDELEDYSLIKIRGEAFQKNEIKWLKKKKVDSQKLIERIESTNKSILLITADSIDRQAHLGMQILEEKAGMIIHSIEPYESADLAGLSKGDNIISLQGEKTDNLNHFFNVLIRNDNIGALDIQVIRNGKRKNLKMELFPRQNHFLHGCSLPMEIINLSEIRK